MSVRIGNACLDENGNISGGVAGDQTGNEVKVQAWYKHSKGWVVYRPNDSAIAEKIAKDMEYACANNKIGYDQGQRNTLYTQASKYGFDCSKVTIACECDCSALVRVCLAYAGIMVGSFSTSSEHSVLMSTGRFTKLTDTKHTASSDYLKRGDILVTATKGHTAIVLDNGAKVATESQPVSTATNIGSNIDPELNVRKTPNGTVVDVFNKGVAVKIVATEGNWYKIEYQGGYAYVYKDFINLDTKNEVKYLAYCNDDTGLNVRKTANGAKLGTFNYNDVVGVIAEEGNWCKIKYGDTYAYVYKDYLTKESETIKFWGEVTDGSLNIRSTPSSVNTSNIVGKFTTYPRVRVYSTRGNWYKIKYDVRDAYIYSSYVKKI